MDERMNHMQDRGLIQRCSMSKSSSEHDWIEFTEKYEPYIERWIIKTLNRFGGYISSDSIADVKQSVFLSLLKDDRNALKRFIGKHKHSFLAYLKVISCRATLAHLNRERRHRFLSLDDGAEDSGSATDWRTPATTDDGLSLHFLEREIKAILRKCYRSRNQLRDIRVFSLVHFSKLPAKEIVKLPDINLSVSGLETVISRMRGRIRENRKLYYA